MRKFLSRALVVGALVAPAGAIVGGTVDSGNAYDNVGVVVLRFTNQPGGLLCSGTLIHPRVVLTAGHCVFGFQQAIASGASDIGQLSVNFAAESAPGPVGSLGHLPVSAMVLHPDYNPQSQMSSEQTDIGLLILAEPVTGITPACLPTAGLADSLGKGKGSKPALRVVGYGARLDPLAPPTPVLDVPFTREYVDSVLKQVLARHINLQQNTRASGNDGGSCFGDSGGPAFATDAAGKRVLLGVTSWGDQKCVGTGFCARVDRTEVLDFIASNFP